MIIFHSIVVLVFIVLGIIFMSDKGAFLIAGYNTYNKEKKEKINEKALLACISKAMFIIAGTFVIILLSDFLKSTIVFFIGLGLFFTTTITAVLYISFSKKFIR